MLSGPAHHRLSYQIPSSIRDGARRREPCQIEAERLPEAALIVASRIRGANGAWKRSRSVAVAIAVLDPKFDATTVDFPWRSGATRPEKNLEEQDASAPAERNPPKSLKRLVGAQGLEPWTR